MSLRVIGAGLPRTATSSLGRALEMLLGGEVHEMSAIPGHPFDLGADWDLALAGGTPDWEKVFADFVASEDWPASQFWRELSLVYPDALILLSVRDSAQVWWESANATILPYARMTLAPDWNGGTGFRRLLERFTGTPDWDDPAILMASYERFNADVRATAPKDRFLEWNAKEGWEPICKALNLPVPDVPFPWTNKREDWG
ncbi:MAG: sulfotransferase family protein [Chloroflexi bacterium]|nr:sulfotransferase family protein [Chloroflexota bacterium]